MSVYVPRVFGAPVLINRTSGYMVLISGQPVFVQAGTLTIARSIGKRSQASMTVKTNTLTHFQQDQQVLIYDRTNTLAFSGYIASPQENKPGFQPSLVHQITCVDQHRLADKRIVAASFVNKTAGYIAQWIAQNVLAQEGVTVGQIYDGLTPSTTLYPSPTLYPGGNVGLIPQANFVYCKASQALDALVQAASNAGVPYFWMIDHLLRFYFVPYTTFVGTYTDGTTIDQVYQPPKVTRANPSYRNTQYILGGVAQTVTQTETRVGDSNTQSWTMGYDLNSAPVITVNSVAQTVGIKGTSGSQFYWAQGSPIITQDAGQPKLTSSQTLQVVYIGQYPAVIIAQDSAQVATEALRDGTSGIVEEAETDNTITSVANGLSEASQLLTRYAQDGAQFVFSTLDSSYLPGQLITVNLPSHGFYNTQMLVSQISGSDQQDGYNIWYQVTAVAGPYDVTWVDFFSKLLAQPQQAGNINIGVTQQVTLLANFTGNIAMSGTWTASVYACPLPSTSLFPSSTLFPC